MKLYKLPFVMREPNDDSEDSCMAEIPSLPGCRAWGNTAAEALENLQGFTTAFIESYRDRGDSLPPEVEALSEGIEGPRALSEVLIAV